MRKLFPSGFPVVSFFFVIAAMPTASAQVPTTASTLDPILAPSHARSVLAANDNGCPDGYPLDCGNNQCCPAGFTLYCGPLAPSPCVNPATLSDEQLRVLGTSCNPLLSCQ